MSTCETGVITQAPITPLYNSIPAHLVDRFDPVYVEWYNKYNVGRPHTHQVPIEDYRKDPDKYTVTWGRAKVKDVFRVTDHHVAVGEGASAGTITVRMYEPERPQGEEGKLLPAYINYHGGGWVFGDLHSEEDFCKRLVHEVGCVAFDVDYRMSPEWKFPVPIDDSWQAFTWIQDNSSNLCIDPSKIAVGGLSAGGHIAALVALQARDARRPLTFQLLAVPVCDLHVFSPEGKLLDSCPYESYREMHDTVALPCERMEYFHRAFLGNPRPPQYDQEPLKSRISPIYASSLANLPPALVITAELDPLRDEGEAYAARLEREHTPVSVHRIKGVPHPFMKMDGVLEGGREYNALCVAALKQALFES